MSEDRHQTALLIVDMQNGFLDSKGSMATIGMEWKKLTAAIDGCERLVTSARRSKVPVIFTRFVYLPGYADAGLVPAGLMSTMKEARSLEVGSWDADIIDSLAPESDEVVIDKSRPSSFYCTRLEPVLTSLGVTTLVIGGVTTNVCVETTARDAGQRDYRTIVVSDATAEYEDDRHEVALRTIGYAFGWVKTVDEVTANWNPSQTA